MKSFSAEEQSKKIHLVGHGKLQVRQLDPKDIVRETLTIARDCGQAPAGIDLKKDHLLVELVASLVVVRLRKVDTR